MRIFLLVLFGLFTPPCIAQDFLFDAEQWDEPNIYLNQSGADQFEAILDGNPKFEPLARYAPDSRIRKLSRPVGRLRIRFDTGQFTVCTATLVAQDVLVTNNHCVPGRGKHGTVKAVALELGVYNIVNPNYSRYEVDVEPLYTNSRFDVSMLRVDAGASSKFGIAKINFSEIPKDSDLTIVHHPAGRVKHVTRLGCLAGPLSNRLSGHFAHKCDTLPGSSGAPIFNDSEEVVGIHCCGTTKRGEDAFNFGKVLNLVPFDRNLILPKKVVQPTVPQLNNYKVVARAMQEAMREAGCFNGSIDGKFGPLSASSFKTLALKFPTECGRLNDLGEAPRGKPVSPAWISSATTNIRKLQQCGAARNLCNSEQKPESALSSLCSKYSGLGQANWRNRYITESFKGSLHVFIKSYPGLSFEQANSELGKLKALYPEVGFELMPTIHLTGGNQMYAAVIAEGQTSESVVRELTAFARKCPFPDGRPPIAEDAYAYRQLVGQYFIESAYFDQF